MDEQKRAGANADAELWAEAYRRMVRIRLFEQKVAELQKGGEVVGAAHTCPGEEAAIVGTLMAVTANDYMTGTHRSHGHPIGKGAAVAPLFAELMGRANGICKGKGGSLHLADFGVGSLGESGILASAIPIAVGAAFSAKMRRSGQVAVSFFGDGASNEGAFHESMNLAAVWKLPVIFLCENNGYGISLPIAAGMAVTDVAARAAGYGMPSEIVDGQDFFAVYQAAARAVARARAGEGPTLIEAKTYLFGPHALGLSAKYRPAAEEEAWNARDPLDIFRAHMVETKAFTEAELDALLEGERAGIAAAAEEARAGPFPSIESVFEDFYADPIPIPDQARWLREHAQ